MITGNQIKRGSRRVGAVRSRVINVRLAPEEMESVERSAVAAAMTVSAFMRSLSLEGAGVSPFLNDDDQAIFDLLRDELRRIGVNLNGLTRSVHRGKIREPEIAAQLAELRPVIAALGLELGKLTERAAAKRRRVG